MSGAEYPRIGVVLSSGGVRGVYAHTGFLLALESLGLPISAIAGCSAGALVGGFVASGTALQQWAGALENLSPREFWSPDALPRFLWQMMRHRGRGYTGLSSTSAALQFCHRNLAVDTFEQCQYPFYALAINLSSGEKTVFSSGELAPHMVASAAVPVLYRPVVIDGTYYCDGALVDFAPTDAICCRHRLDVVIVHHVAQRLDRPNDIESALKCPWTLLEIINRLMFRERPWYLSDEQLTLQRCPCGCGAQIIAIEPSLPEWRWPVTEGGLQVMNDARAQTEHLLGPYQNALKNDPRGQLPLTSVVCSKNPVAKSGTCSTVTDTTRRPNDE